MPMTFNGNEATTNEFVHELRERTRFWADRYKNAKNSSAAVRHDDDIQEAKLVGVRLYRCVVGRHLSMDIGPHDICQPAGLTTWREHTLMTMAQAGLLVAIEAFFNVAAKKSVLDYLDDIQVEPGFTTPQHKIGLPAVAISDAREQLVDEQKEVLAKAAAAAAAAAAVIAAAPALAAVGLADALAAQALAVPVPEA
jgi:hypothetical protein